MKKIDTQNYINIIRRIEEITGKTTPDIIISLCDSQAEYVSLLYNNADYFPQYIPDYIL